MTISILGCGWLGFPLGQSLLRHGYEVKGSTTTQSKFEIIRENGIEPFLLSVPETVNESSNDAFWDSNSLFLNIPPERSEKNLEDTYPEKIKSVCDRILKTDSKNRIKQVIFASSTSVYPSEEGIYSEEDADLSNTARLSGKAILKAEKLLQSYSVFSTVILRFGGLYGYDRHPVRYLAGKEDLSSPYKPVNLIHQDDCIQIVRKFLNSDSVSGVFNAVSDGHPPRETFYQSAADHFSVEIPTFDSSTESINRVISNEKLKKEMDYKFIYPNPLDHTA